ncbi:unnamed protein product [Amoebophrya sp. A120]|nr:unnamed protein product [Amoebophrya sp. A120]|eukprot:GSA120T00022399001.1
MSEFLRQYLIRGNTAMGYGGADRDRNITNIGGYQSKSRMANNQNDADKANDQIQIPTREIRFKTSFHNTVLDVLRSRGYKETDAELEWDIHWCDREWIHDNLDYVHLQPFQRVNHFRNHFELTRKDLLIKHLKRAKKAAEKQFGSNSKEAELYANITPTTFSLPTEYSVFVEEFKKSAKEKIGKHWIMKPVGKAQGKGIFLFDSLKAISDWRPAEPRWKNQDNKKSKDKDDEQPREIEPYVVQRYIANPLLIGGRKFDLRLYVLVTSWSPLVVYLYRSGFARFSGGRFNLKSADLAIHLTNVAIQKHQDNYDEKRGGKWDLQHLKSYLYTAYSRDEVNHMFHEIQEVILRSLFAVQGAIISDKHCFELYGFDVIVSSDLRPWLLEVNSSPSLTATTREDYELKFGLLDDTFTVLDLENYFKGQIEDQVGGFDLIYKAGVKIEPPPNAVYRTYLGCQNNRREQLKRLARALAAKQELNNADNSNGGENTTQSTAAGRGGGGGGGGSSGCTSSFSAFTNSGIQLGGQNNASSSFAGGGSSGAGPVGTTSSSGGGAGMASGKNDGQEGSNMTGLATFLRTSVNNAGLPSRMSTT